MPPPGVAMSAEAVSLVVRGEANANNPVFMLQRTCLSWMRLQPKLRGAPTFGGSSLRRHIAEK